MKSSFTTLLPLLLALSTPTLAGSCGALSPCGEVDNKSSHTLKYTTKLEDSGCKKKDCPDYCDVWNHDGGTKVFNPPVHVQCHQQSIGPKGGKKGGGNVDVDAFCYADRKYRVQYRGGVTKTIPKGVWTKIKSDEKGTCYDNDLLGMPACFVEFDL